MSVCAFVYLLRVCVLRISLSIQTHLCASPCRLRHQPPRPCHKIFALEGLKYWSLGRSLELGSPVL